MDLFGKKRIAELEAEVKALRQDRADIAFDLRRVDQAVFDMAMQPSWELMRPKFAKLCELTNVRLLDEHKRITSIMLPELNRTYGK